VRGQGSAERGPRLGTAFVTVSAIVALAFCAGVAFAASTSTGRARATVVFLGDSNEVLPATSIAIDLLTRDNGYIVVNVARPGATIRYGDCPQRTSCATYNYWQSRVLDTLAAVHPDVFVVNLGINDAARPGTETTPGYVSYGAKIDWLLSRLGSTPVVWSNLPCKSEPSFYATGCKAVNAAIAAARSRHSNLTLLNWGAVANAHPKYVGAPPNGVHLTAAGEAAWAGLITDKLDSMFGLPS
jgi:GDSL-like lipase/acylhydrolase family protein